MSDDLEGLDGATRLLTALPDAMREELGEELKEIGSLALAVQLALVHVRTGALARALDFTVALNVLRLRVGLTALKRQKNLWYAIIMEYGRAPGAKPVVRRRGGMAANGKRKRKIDAVVSRYMLHWSGIAAQPFVHIEDRIDAIADERLGDFWDRVAARAEG